MPNHAHAQPLRRMLALRQFPSLAGIELGELATLADNLTETTLAVGHQVVTKGSAIPALHLVIDGCIEAEGDSWGPRDVFGLLEVLASRPAMASARVPIATHTYQITAEDALEVLEDNLGMLRSVLRELARRLVVLGVRPASPLPLLVTPVDRLTLVERLIVLRRQLPFAGGRLQALSALAHALEPRRWEPGESVVEATEPADTMIMVLDGRMQSSRSDRAPEIILPGDAIGGLELLGGVKHLASVVAIAPTSALCCPATAILDILEDHSDLGLAMTATLAGLVLDALVPPGN
jgi:CRP-like cAMP-binding protein